MPDTTRTTSDKPQSPSVGKVTARLEFGAAETCIWVLENALGGTRTLGMDDEDKDNIRSLIAALKGAHIIEIPDDL